LPTSITTRLREVGVHVIRDVLIGRVDDVIEIRVASKISAAGHRIEVVDGAFERVDAVLHRRADAALRQHGLDAANSGLRRIRGLALSGNPELLVLASRYVRVHLRDERPVIGVVIGISSTLKRKAQIPLSRSPWVLRRFGIRGRRDHRKP
jgi:superfamily I DNA and RNA helicase